MTKKMDKTFIITTLVCLLPIILALALYDKLPDQIAIHWDASGAPDNYASKLVAVWVLPLLMAVINIITNFLITMDPKRDNASSALKLLGRWFTPILSVITIPITLFSAIGYDIPIQIVVPAMVGIILVIFGNYLPKCKQNYTIGIRLPWTLNSEENWNRTHRIAGYVWTTGGLCMVIGSFMDMNWLPLTLIIIAVLTLVPFIYSFMLYKRGI